MSSIARELEKIINNLEKDTAIFQYNSYDFSKTDTDYKYTIVATGIQKNDLNIEVVDGCLVLKAKPSVKTRFSKDLNHLIYLFEDVDAENITANLSDGLLTVTLPKIKQAKKNVKITIS